MDRHDRPRCLACGTLIDARPEAQTFRLRGAFAIVVQWRVCACGAFSRTQRVCPRPASRRVVDSAASLEA